MVDVGQASLRGGAPHHDSPRIRVAQAPPPYAAFGDLYVVVQGRSDRLCREFGDAVVAAYYSSDTTSIIAGLMNGMRQASHTVAIGAGPHDPLESLGATGAVLTDDELYIAQLAPSQVYILRDATLNALPDRNTADPSSDPDLLLEQDVDLFRARLQDGDAIVLASTDLRHELTEREIRGLLSRRTAQEAAYDLCALVGQRGGERCEVLVLRVATPPSSERLPDHALGDVGDSLVRGDNGRPGVAEPRRPTVVIREPDWDLEAESPAAGRRLRRDRSRAERLAALPLTLITLVLVMPVLAIRGLLGLFGGRRDRQAPRPGRVAAPSPPADPILDDDWSSLRELRAAGPRGARARQAAGAAESGPRSPIDHFSAPISRANLDPLLHRRRRSLPGPGTILFGLSLVLLIVMAVVLVLRNGSQDGALPEQDAAAATPAGTQAAGAPLAPVAGAGTESAALNLFDEAEARYREAQSRDPGDNRSATLLILRDAKDLANQALAANLNRSLAPDINRLLSQIGREEDRLNRVRKLVPSATIGEFETAGVGSSIEPLDVRVDAKYVIDAVTGRVVEFATAKQGATVLRKGDVVGSVTVQDPIAVLNRALSTLVMDSRYNLFSLQADQNPRLLRIDGTDQWRTPVAFDNFNNNFYVLDPGANTILKYQATAGGYEIAALDYLDPREDIDLTQAVDFAIDGDIYVLFADSSLRRFRGGRELEFRITGMDGDAVRASALFTEVDADSLYLVDASNRRIVEIDKRDGSAGAFVRQFRYAGSDDFFADIRAIWVSEIDGKLIVLGKDSIRQFVLPRIQDAADAQPGG